MVRIMKSSFDDIGNTDLNTVAANSDGRLMLWVALALVFLATAAFFVTHTERGTLSGRLSAKVAGAGAFVGLLALSAAFLVA